MFAVSFANDGGQRECGHKNFFDNNLTSLSVVFFWLLSPTFCCVMSSIFSPFSSLKRKDGKTHNCFGSEDTGQQFFAPFFLELGSQNAGTRTFMDYDSIPASMDGFLLISKKRPKKWLLSSGICQMFETFLRSRNPQVPNITYDIADLYM